MQPANVKASRIERDRIMIKASKPPLMRNERLNKMLAAKLPLMKNERLK